jgi:hypothetical protein
MKPPKLTKKQINRIEVDLLLGKKHWSTKIPHAIGIIKTFYKEITPSELEWFLELYVPAEKKRLHQEFMSKSASGELHNKFTPTDVSRDLGNEFDVVIDPVIGVKYHLSWAYKGAVFVLKHVEGDHCYLDNPKHPRKQLLKAKIIDLRGLNKRL